MSAEGSMQMQIDDVPQLVDGLPLPPGIKRFAYKHPNGSTQYRYHDGEKLISGFIVKQLALEYDTNKKVSERSRENVAKRVAERRAKREQFITNNPHKVSNLAIDDHELPPWIAYKMYVQQEDNRDQINRYFDIVNNLWISRAEALAAAEEWKHRNDPPERYIDEYGDCACFNCPCNDCTHEVCPCEDCPCLDAIAELTKKETEHYTQTRVDREETANFAFVPSSYRMDASKLERIDLEEDDGLGLSFAIAGFSVLVEREMVAILSDNATRIEIPRDVYRRIVAKIETYADPLGYD